MLFISDLLFPSFKMGIEQEAIVGNLAHPSVEFLDNFLTMVAHWKCLVAREWLEWTEEDDAVLMGHSLWNSRRFLEVL